MSLNTENITSIYNHFITIQDSIKITKRSLREDTPKLKKHTIFEDVNHEESIQKMETAKREYSDLIVLSLFASFERQLRDEISAKGSKLLEIIPTDLGESLNLLTQKEMERWRTSEVLDLFKFAVVETVRGQIKQILDYRNWIAHGKKSNHLPANRVVDPTITYETILAFISQVQNYDQ